MEKQSRILCFMFSGWLLLVAWQMPGAYEVNENNRHLHIRFFTQLKGPWKEWSVSLVALSWAGFILPVCVLVVLGRFQEGK